MQPAQIPRPDIRLPERVAFLSDILVLPAARRRGIGRALLIESMRMLREESFAVLGCHIPEGNQASVRLFSSVGFRPLGRIQFVRILGLPRFSTTPEEMLESMTLAQS